MPFFCCSPALQGQDWSATVCCPDPAQSHHHQPSPGSLQPCCSCGVFVVPGSMEGAHPHCVGQGDRRKAVLSSAAAQFSFDSFIFIAFNNFLCSVMNKSPCQGTHSLPGIAAGCSHITSMCHYTQGVAGMHFVCSGLSVLQNQPSHCEVSEFHLPSTHRWEPSALAKLLTLALVILFSLIEYLFKPWGLK